MPEGRSRSATDGAPARRHAAWGALADEQSLILALTRLSEGAPAASLPFLDAGERRRQVGAGEHSVHQDFDINMTPPAGSLVCAFAATLGLRLGQALALLAQPPLPLDFRFNDVVIQRYPAGSAGITAHRDHLRYRGLIALLSLSGSARLFTCRERAGDDPREVDCAPGRLVLMPAPGFAGGDARPFHFLRDIRHRRYSLGIRYDRDWSQDWARA